MGEPLLAYDVVSRDLSEGSGRGNVRLRQLLALALARTCATEKANTILKELKDQGHADGETLGLLARTYKDLWKLVPDIEIGKLHLEAAYNLYFTAFQQAEQKKNADDGIYNGINAAALCQFLDRKKRQQPWLVKSKNCAIKGSE